MNKLVTSSPLARLVGLTLLFLVISWAFYIHLPTMSPGYLNAGDDHIHVAFANELARIWQEEGKLLGWSRLYATGSPIFILRPPGFYMATVMTHFLTGITVEQALKMVVLFGFCLYPLTIFIGSRLLGLGFWASVFGGMLSVLPISLWGHTFDAYQYLGVHKQLLAILFFPMAVGSLWNLLKDGKTGLLFAVSFAIMFITHPYIAYCFTLLTPCMLFALVCLEPDWHWQKRIKEAMLWSIPALLFVCIWLIPFVFSDEIQVIDPFLSRRKAFDVVVSTTAETFRQFFLGGIFDTTRFAGPFGGIDWISGNEWGWIPNKKFFRIPIISILCFVGWLVMFIRPKRAVHGFLGMAFLVAFLLFIGPDDFPFLDAIPFAKKFQNVHAIFLLEWVAILLGGFACQWLYQKMSGIPSRVWRYGVYLLVTILIGTGFGTAINERTMTAKRLIDVRNIHTTNGELSMRPGIHRDWKYFENVVDILQESQGQGNISAMPLSHDDAVLYNLLPLMVNRPVFITGFEMVGGVYSLLLYRFRSYLRDNYEIQKLFNIRYVINSPYYRKKPMQWHDATEVLYQNKFYELIRVKGDFGDLAALPDKFAGFVGSEREWDQLMEEWLRELSRGEDIPWLINLTNSGMDTAKLERLRPFLKVLVLGKDSKPPSMFTGLPSLELGFPVRPFIKTFKEQVTGIFNEEEGHGLLAYETPVFDKILNSRKKEMFSIDIKEELRPVLFKRAFYRGWQARLDGEEIPVYRVSPGLQMVLVPRGVHELSYHYTGPVYWPWARAAFWLGLIISGLLIWRRYRFKSTELEERAPSGWRKFRGKYLVYFPSAIWLVFLVMFTYKIINEAVFKVPVIILPGPGQVVSGTTVDFYWNYVVGIS
ncbi:MAG: hypothetical protein JRF05_06870, partial [Deltaproteobacteria bacterium]|nr:hypothetical protein [Deltaproteobacteria bacterium]